MTPIEARQQEERNRFLRRIRKLRRGSQLRLLAEQAVRNAIGPVEDVSPLLETFSRNGANEAAVAAWLLGRIPLSEAQRQPCAAALSAVIQESQRSGRGQRADRCFRYGLLFGTAGMLAILLLGLTAWNSEALLFHSLFALVVFGLAGFTFSMLLLPVMLATDIGSRHSFQATVRALGYLRLPESVSVLAEAALCEPVREAGQAALGRVLPALTPEHTGCLRCRTIPDLCRLLNASDDGFVVVVLEALEKIGDARALRAVERLAETPYWASAPVRAAAARTLAALRERRQQEEAPRLLLRASSAADLALEGLLRPGATTSVGPETLLRADMASHN